MKAKRDISGKIFGQLSVAWPVGFMGRGPKRKVIGWLCFCTCGKKCVVSEENLRWAGTESCGCLRYLSGEARKKRQSYYRVHGMADSPEYKSFHQARYRCTRKSSNRWHRYGGRGIKFKFKSFMQFYKEVGPKPSPVHSIDRINNNGHYEPGNVKWSTPKEQCSHRGRKIKSLNK